MGSHTRNSMEGVKPKKYSFKHFLLGLLLISVIVVVVYNFTIRSFNSNYQSAKFTIPPPGSTAELQSSSISDTKPSKMVTPDLPSTNTTIRSQHPQGADPWIQ